MERSCRSRNLNGYCAAPRKTFDDYTPIKVLLANSFEVAFKPLLLEVIFAMQGHFSVVRPVACGVFSYRAWPYGSLVDGRKPLFWWSSIDIYSSLNCKSKIGLANIAISKKSGQKVVPDAFPARLKEGRNTFPALPSLSGPGMHAFHSPSGACGVFQPLRRRLWLVNAIETITWYVRKSFLRQDPPPWFEFLVILTFCTMV